MSTDGAEGRSFCINQTANITVSQPVQGRNNVRHSHSVVTPLRTVNGTAVVPSSTVFVSNRPQPRSALIDKLILKATYKEGKCLF